MELAENLGGQIADKSKPASVTRVSPATGKMVQVKFNPGGVVREGLVKATVTDLKRGFQE